MATSLAHYSILNEIGRGGMGVVYRAVDNKIGREVALKMISMQDVRDPAERTLMVERFRREARAAGVLSHPNIVTIYELGEAGGCAYIVMEFVNGPSLSHLMKQPGGVPRELAVAVVRQAGAALDSAHAKGIIHRDVKPGNILIDEAGIVKLTDFGVAKTLRDQTVTQTGFAVGTPSYMSPEQIRAEALTGRSDQFSLAVVAYELLTNRKPFPGETLPTLVNQVLFEEPPRADSLDRSLGAAVGGVLARAMGKQPVQRYALCSDFAAELSAALRRSSGASGRAARDLRRWKPWPAVALGVVAAACATALAVSLVLRRAELPTSVQPVMPKNVPQTALPAGPPPARRETLPSFSLPKTEKAKPSQEAATERKPPVSFSRLPPPPVIAAPPKSPQDSLIPAAVTPANDPPPTPSPPPPVKGPWRGGLEGTFSWSGSLPAGARLVYTPQGLAEGGGIFKGPRFPFWPDTEVAVEQVEPAGAVIEALPSAENQWSRLVVRNDSASTLSFIRLRWKVRHSPQ